MGTDGETKVFLVVAVMLLSFSLVLTMIASESSWLFANTEGYEPVAIPSQFDMTDLGMGTVISQDYILNITYENNYRYFYLSKTGGANDTTISYVWYSAHPDEIYFTHYHPIWWIFGTYEEMFPYPVTKNYVLSHLSENRSSFFVRCVKADATVYCQITFDNSTYADLEEAWDDGYINLYVAFLTNSTYEAMSYSFWDVFANIISFQSYSIFPYPLHLFVGGFFWISIAVIVLYIVKGWL